MAHNTHIPWTLLSSNLKFTPTSISHSGNTNLYPRHLSHQGSQLRHFTSVFTKKLLEFSATERSKHPSPTATATPDPDELVISDEVAKKIKPTVSKYRRTNQAFVARQTCLPSCELTYPFHLSLGCLCPLSLEERKLRIWIQELDCKTTTCQFNCRVWRDNHSDLLELLKTLLLYGEIGVLLRIFSHEEVRMNDRIWNEEYSTDGFWGVGEMVRGVLMSYLFLNVVFLHPETWDPVSRRGFIEEKTRSGKVYMDEEVDYRKMVSWEKVLSRTTGKMDCDVHMYPHRAFFGVSEEAYDATEWRRKGAGRRFLKPVIPGKPEVAGQDHYVAGESDVDTVMWYLRLKGLPVELSLQIMRFAGFKAESRVPVANDPLNVENREELVKYLSWCWKVLVWTDVLMRDQGRIIEWEYEIAEVVDQLWSDAERGSDWPKGSGKKMCTVLGYRESLDEDERVGNERLALQWSRIVFV